MIRFVTNNNTMYIINLATKTVLGGRYKKPRKFESYSEVKQGYSCCFRLQDGGEFKTGVVRYIG